MRRCVSRRAVLGGLLAGAAGPVFASAPETSIRPLPRGTLPAPPDAEALVRKAGLGGRVSFAMADLSTGEIVEARQPDLPLPPASVAKAVTALYALDMLGPQHRFATELLATGPIVNGRIEGDLVLAGSGDPTFDTDALGALAAGLKEAGVREISGGFRIWSGALPTIAEIDADQPPHVGYNPTIGGLNLNFNRVHFEWKRNGSGYDVTMEARGQRFSPAVGVAEMSIDGEQKPVYVYRQENGIEQWSVARRALGNGGARWLPVRRPVAYAEDVFLTIARSYGIVLKPGERLAARPEGTVLARQESGDLTAMMRGMLRYSTNLTAEAAGLAASATVGPIAPTLAASARRMNAWASIRLGAASPGLVDHSGLGYASSVSAGDMVRMLVAAHGDGQLRPILRQINVSDADGDRVSEDRLSVAAKTGTLNFTSALAGYCRAGNGRDMAFAVFSADTDRRDAIPVAQRERPEGARSWARRSRRMQQDLLLRWAALRST